MVRKHSTEKVLEDFFDLELPVFKPAKPTKVFDSEVMKVFDSVDGLANSILFKTKRKTRKTLSKRRTTKKKTRGKTIFFPAKHKKLSKIISIVSPEEARKSVRKIKKMVGKSRFTKKQLRGALILAGARAKALAKKSGISLKEKRELKKVAEIYFRGARAI